MRRRKDEEAEIQKAVVFWLRTVHPEILFTIAPSGMKLPISVATKFKRMGYSKGTPDIMIFEPSGVFHGLFIELKTDTGRVTIEQRCWLKELDKRGYYTIVCRSVDQCRSIIEKYLERKGE